MKKTGSTITLSAPPTIFASASVVGAKEGEGPLKAGFDYISDDSYFGESSWEKAESSMFRRCFTTVCDKAKIAPSELDFVCAGDLLNQCIGSAFALKDSKVPYFGLYGACSTMAESLSLASLLLDGGFADHVCAMTGSHFCSAERQFRLPLEYGGQRTPTAQWTATAAGCVLLSADGSGPYITHVATGQIVDAGIKDPNNMGAAMAPAAYETLKAIFDESGSGPETFDLILTGDLAKLGSDVVRDLFLSDGVDLGERYQDCGVMIYDAEKQDVHMGGSGCGCSAAVLCGYVLNGMRAGRWQRVVFAGTGALLSTLTTQQGESIPSICHAVVLSNTK